MILNGRQRNVVKMMERKMRVFNSVSRDGDFGKRIEGYCRAFDRKCDIKDQSESDVYVNLWKAKRSC